MSQLPGARKNMGTDPFGAPPAGYIPGKGRGAVGFAGGVSRDDGPEFQRETDQNLNESNYNAETGYKENLFDNGQYDEEDRVADNMYAEIDARMDARRKRRREEKLKKQLLVERNEKPTLHDQLADVKRALDTVTYEEWDSIPEAQVYNVKKQKRLYTVPTPDLVLKDRDKGSHQHLTVVQETSAGSGLVTPMLNSGLKTPTGLKTPLGLMTPGLMSTGATGVGRLNELGEVKGQLLSVKLDHVIDQVSGHTNIDPKGYLTQLDTQVGTGHGAATNLDDLKKRRMLLKSVTQTNPSHGPGWIAAARLEEGAGEMEAARTRILDGCRTNPKNADLWLEAIRLSPDRKSIALLTKALNQLPYSVPLWSEVVKRSSTVTEKRALLKKAVAFIPNSAKLWRDAISLETSTEDKKSLLNKAVKCLSKGDVEAVQMWLDLAAVCTYTESRKVLNDARKAMPTSPDIWVAAAKLEESNGHDKMPAKMLSKAIPSLQAKGAIVDRETWLAFAQKAEQDGYIHTCEAIIVGGHNNNIERVTRVTTWLDETQECVEKQCYKTAGAILKCTADEVPSRDEVWEAWIQLEMTHGEDDSLTNVLEKASKNCPKNDVFWLMNAKHLWKTLNQPDQAKAILIEATQHFDEDEESLGRLYLALAKIDWENGDTDSARERYATSRAKISDATISEKLLLQQIQLERYAYYQNPNDEQATVLQDLCAEGNQAYPRSWKLWCITAQSMRELARSNHADVTRIYQRGVQANPNAVYLWRDAIQFENAVGNYGRASALIDNAKLHNVNDPIILLTELENVRAMGESGNHHAKDNLSSFISNALKNVPNSGLLWHFAVNVAEVRAKSTVVTDGLKMLERDPFVVWAGAECFLAQDKIVQARKWYHHATTLNDKIGDIWASYVAFELLHGDETSQSDVINKAFNASPGINRGIQWNQLVKKVVMWREIFPRQLRRYLEIHHPEALQSAKMASVVREVLLSDSVDSTADVEMKQA